MSSLQELVEQHTRLPDVALDQLQAVVSDWQMLADLSFADLLLFCRLAEDGPEVAGGGPDVPPADSGGPGRGADLLVVGQMRPYTAQTIYYEDLVGQRFEPAERPAVMRAFASGGIIRDGDPDWSRGVPVREEAIPVPLGDEIIAVVTREANLSMVRSPSQLELTYLQTANELSAMLAEGSFPHPGEDPERELAPRVGDGLMRLDPDGVVVYASPNAISAYRRLGMVDNIMGRNLGEFDLDDIAMLDALGDGEPLESEVEGRGTVVLRRLIPLTRKHEVLGGLVLLREITELRRHERLLLYKDAMIREIHHRVKNNLQTVASLLRLQSRRLVGEEATEALSESVRRISSIALVHETLSQDSRQQVSFDKVTQRLLDMVGTGLTDPDHPVTMSTRGSAGELPPEVATPLALVLSELLQNAVEHAFPNREGRVQVTLERDPPMLRLEIRDDGVGVPEGWSVEADAHLGLQIASTLVVSELGGSLEVDAPADGPGTCCVVAIPLPE